MKLYSKILLAFVPLTFLAAGLVVYFSKTAIHRILVEELAQRGVLEAKRAADSMTSNFPALKERQLLLVLQGSIERLGALYGMVLDTRGLILAHTNVAEKGKRYMDNESNRSLKTETLLSQTVKWGGKNVLDISYPLFVESLPTTEEEFLLAGKESPQVKKRLGTIRLGMPLNEAAQIGNRISQQVGIILCVFGCLFFLGEILFIRKILRPIGFLVRATEKIGRGEYSAKIPVLSQDEIGDLSQSFNRMSELLTQTTISKEYFNGIIENMFDPLVVTNREGLIQLVNSATCRTFGFDSQELIGQSVGVVLGGSKGEVFGGNEGDSKLIFKDRELQISKKDGKEAVVLCSSTPFSFQKDEFSGIIFMMKDMTEKKRLEKLVYQSEKLSAVGQLAAGVAHEINNPLGIILGFAQGLVKKIPRDSPFELPLKSIEREATRCKNLVQDLLTFSRASRSERIPMEINQAISEALTLVETHAKIKQVVVEKELEVNLPRILGNKTQIQQVVINLANNALDVLQPGGVIKVKTEFSEDVPQSWVCLRVVDNGPGIPEGTLSKIFEPFFTTKPIGQGTGLGLSLVHEISKKHSALIDVKSQSGCTEFLIRFPVRSEKELEERMRDEHERLSEENFKTRFG